jgi:DNA primase
MYGLQDQDLLFLLEHLKEKWEHSNNFSNNPNAFEGLKKVGNSYMFCCPAHMETRPSCGIMTEEPFGWNCFSCGAHGSLSSLVSLVIGGTQIHGEYYIDKLFFYNKGKSKPNELTTLFPLLDKLDQKNMRGDGLTEEEVLKYKGIRHMYMYQRGFNNRAIDKYELGYDKETDSIVFPVRDHTGAIRFLKRRHVSRKLFFNDVGIEKRDILYGLYYITQAPSPIKEIYMVESETDVIACYMNKMPAVALMGRIFFKEMLLPLHKAKIERINLFLDNDIRGSEATEIVYNTLYKNGFSVRIARYASKEKDANELLVTGKLKDIKFYLPDSIWDLQEVGGVKVYFPKRKEDFINANT